MKKKQILTAVCLGLAACWLGIAIAGDINYGGDPASGSGMPTLQEVYDYLVNATPETPNAAFQEPAGAPGPTGKTTREIYEAVKAERDTDLISGNIKDTVEIFGVTGTYTGGPAYPALVPDTGDPAEPEPNGVNWPNPRFTVNGDGTVTDELTGLMWLQDADCVGQRAWTTVDTSAKVTTLVDAAACTNYTGGTYTDWRLPTLRELQSLVHYGFFNPAVSDTAGTAKWTANGAPFNDVQSDYCWSGTTHAVNADYAWNVNMHYGDVYYTYKATTYCVWPVRGGQ